MVEGRSRRFIHHVLISLAFGAIVGCKSVPPPPPPTDVPAGSTFQVLVPFSVAPGSNSTYFQDATQRHEKELDAVNTYCRFTTAASSVGGKPSNSGPLVGIIRYTVKDDEYNAREKAPGDRFVSSVRYTLSGPRPDTVAYLTCVVPDASAQGRFATPAEISGALGKYFELKLAK